MNEIQLNSFTTKRILSFKFQGSNFCIYKLKLLCHKQWRDKKEIHQSPEHDFRTAVHTLHGSIKRTKNRKSKRLEGKKN